MNTHRAGSTGLPEDEDDYLEAVTPRLATLTTSVVFANTPDAHLLDLRDHLSGIVDSLRKAPFSEGASNG